MHRDSVRIVPWVVTLWLTACAVPSPSQLPVNPPPKPGCQAKECLYTLDPAQATELQFFAHQKCARTRIHVDAGQRYRIKLIELSDIQDGAISSSETPVSPWPNCSANHNVKPGAGTPITELGFCQRKMSKAPVSWLRRSDKHNWFELILAGNSCASKSFVGISELAKEPAGGAYIFEPRVAGELNLFVNDAGWFYANNKGYYKLLLERTE